MTHVSGWFVGAFSDAMLNAPPPCAQTYQRINATARGAATAYAINDPGQVAGTSASGALIHDSVWHKA